MRNKHQIGGLNRYIMAVGLVFLMAAGQVLAGSSSHGSSRSTHAMSDKGTFKHHENIEGVKTEFEIMSLASMNMTDPEGKSHHIMLKLYDESGKQPIKGAVGKIKVVNPDGSEQVGTLKDYGGILAANFNFDLAGKYGVICLFKVKDKKRVVKFWYNNS